MRLLRFAAVLLIVLVGLFSIVQIVCAHGEEVGWINISSIGLDSPVVVVGRREFMVGNVRVCQTLVDNTCVGWHDHSAQPGQGDNIVLNGHSNIEGRIFRDLWKVKVGDEIILRWAGSEFRYVVIHRLLLREKGVSFNQRVANANVILPTGYERLTLVTCYGLRAEYRLVIIAEPITTV